MKCFRKKTDPSEGGNALFLILLGIILLAALTFALAPSSGRRQSGAMSAEDATLAANEIMSHANKVSQGVQQLMINGCMDTDINFENSAVANYVNPNAPADDSCDVFSKAGAGLEWRDPKTEWLDSAHSARISYGEVVYTGGTCVARVGTGGILCASQDSSTDSEIIMLYPYIKKEICLQINKSLGIQETAGEPPSESGLQFSATEANLKYKGTFPAPGGLTPKISSAALYGKYAGCMKGDTSLGYHFYQVLVAR